MKIAILGANGFLGSYLYNHFNAQSDCTAIPVTRATVNLNDYAAVDQWLDRCKPDVIINCAISGGGLKVNDINYSDVQRDLGIFLNFYNNSKVQKYINVGSGAEFDRRTNILNCTEEDIKFATPVDSYGYTKNVIARLCLDKPGFYTLRLFGCFDSSEPSIRLFKRFLNDATVLIQDKYFDYISAADFAKIVEHFCQNHSLPKDVNCVYREKKLLSEILHVLRPGIDLNLDKSQGFGYTGSGKVLADLNIQLDGLEKGIKNYE